ncbi:saccharopine dehydrogenase family protein [candidate division KSB1 bacterium]
MINKCVVILGLGMQGKAALYDIFQNSDVGKIIAVDNIPDPDGCISQYFSDRVSFKKIDINDISKITSVLKKADIIIETLPGNYALPVGRLAAGLGIDLVSSMYYTDPSETDSSKLKKQLGDLKRIDKDLRDKGKIILTEFGLDPGLDLILSERILRDMDEVSEFYSYGSGIPEFEAADNPLKYKFSWSVSGVMRAYIRSARIITGGKVKVIEAGDTFSKENIHILKISEMGKPVECYPNGDTVKYAEIFGLEKKVKEMARYTSRWRGHCAFWEKMIKSGFLREEPVNLGGVEVSPVEYASGILGSQQQFQYKPDEKDIAMIRIDIRGISAGRKKRIIYQIVDKKDKKTGFTAMQRTVGFTMSLGAKLILEGKINKKGLLAPIDVPLELLEDGLRERDIIIKKREYKLN